MPDETRVGFVRLKVADLGRSLAYYEGTLGLRARTRSTRAAELVAGNANRVLVELHEHPGARPSPKRGSLGLFHFALLLPDRGALGRFLRHALGHGAVSGVADHAVSEAVYLTDPDGLGIEVYHDRPRTEWRVRPDGELHMTTAPLDVDRLLSASGSEPWEGAPDATTMGHIHLHVGDLLRAETFYHRGVGFDKIVWNYPGALFFSAAGYHHHLGTNTWSSGNPASEDQARLLSWILETVDPDGVADNLRQAGHAVDHQEHARIVADPWGTVIEIRQLTM